MDALVDPVTTPYSSREAIIEEMKEIERLPETPGRDLALQQMRNWLKEKANK